MRIFDIEQIGGVIRLGRVRANLHQSEVAKEVGVSQPTVSNIESGLDSTFPTFISVASACGYQVLVGGEPASAESVSEVIRRNMADRGITKSDISRATSVARSSIGRIIEGRARLATVLTVCACLGIPLDLVRKKNAA